MVTFNGVIRRGQRHRTPAGRHSRDEGPSLSVPAADHRALWTVRASSSPWRNALTGCEGAETNHRGTESTEILMLSLCPLCLGGGFLRASQADVLSPRPARNQAVRSDGPSRS